MNTKWKIWDEDKNYGKLLFDRAVGDSREMESSRAAAIVLKEFVKNNETITDVGCGAGHYLRSIIDVLNVQFKYQGVDATQNYVELAKKAWSSYSFAKFIHGDIYNIPLEDKSSDIVINCNVLLHLPSVKKPIEELLRVAKRVLIIRTLAGDRSFRILDVKPSEINNEEFNDDGEPKNYHYYNIYRKEYLKSLIVANPRVSKVEIFDDKNFNPLNITDDEIKLKGVHYDVTKMISEWQVNGYIMQPWCFIIVHLND